MKQKILVIAGLSFVAMLAAAPTGAHVVVEPKEALAGASYRVVFGVPHGCGGSPTTGIRITVPEGVVAVKPMPKPGWTLATTKGPYERSYAFYHGAVLSEGVRTVEWSGGSLPDEHYDEFVLSVFVAGENAARAKLYFPVVQTCAAGELKWTEVPSKAAAGSELKTPAPSLQLVGKSPSKQH